MWNPDPAHGSDPDRDGGVTWQRSKVGRASVQQSEDGIGPMNLSFVDAGHGWLRVTSRLPGQRAEDETRVLFRTTDGRTWERLPDAPSPGVRTSAAAPAWT